MSAQPEIPQWVASRTVRIRKGLSVRMMVGSTGQMFCEWDPDVPSGLTAKQMRVYRKARDELLAEFMQRQGVTGKGVVLEI